jgi:hypothetical protein
MLLTSIKRGGACAYSSTIPPPRLEAEISLTFWPHRIRFRWDLSSNHPFLPKLIRTPGCLGLRDEVFGEVVIWQIPIAPMNGYSMLKAKARRNGTKEQPFV